MARTAKITNTNVAPSRNTAGLVGNTPVRAQDFNDLVGDYISKTDTNTQDIAGPLTGKYIMHNGFVENTAAFVQNSDSIVEWTQPANTIIKDIIVLVTEAPVTAASASLGYEVGTSSSGAQIVANQADEIIDVGTDGTDLAVGALVDVTMVRATTDAVTLAADASYTTSERTLYFNTVCSNHSVTTAGTVRWLIEYIQFA